MHVANATSSEHSVNRTALVILLLGATIPLSAGAQHEGHVAPHATTSTVPTQAGQDAFAAISEIVGMLAADSSTNWTTVNLEALRQHLIDMNNVVLRASPRVRNIPGGAVFTIEAPEAVRPAVQRMVSMHAVELNRMPEWRASVAVRNSATVLTVVAAEAADSATAQRIRGLGFIGLLATGSHHQAHHLAIAKGQGGGHAAHH